MNKRIFKVIISVIIILLLSAVAAFGAELSPGDEVDEVAGYKVDNPADEKKIIMIIYKGYNPMYDDMGSFYGYEHEYTITYEDLSTITIADNPDGSPTITDQTEAKIGNGVKLGDPTSLLYYTITMPTRIETLRVGDTLENFSNSMYKLSVDILNYVVKPIAYVLLGLFFILELYHLTIVRDATGADAIVIKEYKLILHFAFAKIVIDYSHVIMQALFYLANQLTILAQSFIQNSPEHNVVLQPPVRVVADLARSIPSGGVERTKMWLVLLVVFVISWFAIIIARIVVFGRFIELYLMLAVSAIPLSTIASTEYSQAAKGFIKFFFATVIHAFLIYLVVQFFPRIYNLGSITVNSIGAFAAESIIMSVVLLIAVKSTDSLSKRIVGAM